MATADEGASSDVGVAVAESAQVRPPLPLLTFQSLRNYYHLGHSFANDYAITPNLSVGSTL